MVLVVGIAKVYYDHLIPSLLYSSTCMSCVPSCTQVETIMYRVDNNVFMYYYYLLNLETAAEHYKQHIHTHTHTVNLIHGTKLIKYIIFINFYFIFNK